MELVSSYLEEMEIKKNVKTFNTSMHEESVIAYACEGECSEYYYCCREEAEQKITHWKKTGELIIEDIELGSFLNRKTIKCPTRVMLLNVEARYLRSIPF